MTRPFGVVVGDGLFARARGNPLLTPTRWPYRVNAVMNTGATLVGDQTVLLCRVEDRRGRQTHCSVLVPLRGMAPTSPSARPAPAASIRTGDPFPQRPDHADAAVFAAVCFAAGLWRYPDGTGLLAAPGPPSTDVLRFVKWLAAAAGETRRRRDRRPG